MIQTAAPRTPPRHAPREYREPAGMRGFFELALAEIQEQRKGLIRQSGIEEVRQAIVIDVAEIDSHGGYRRPVVRDRYSRVECHLAKPAIAPALGQGLEHVH